MSEREYFSLPVPVEFLREMTLHLADLERGEAGSRLVSVTGNVDDPETGSNATERRKAGIVWNPDQWANLRDKKTVSGGRVLNFVVGLPIGEDNAQTLSLLAARGSMSANELRAALSWLTRYLRQSPEVYPTDSWPFGWKVGVKVDPENPHEFHYWISEEQRQQFIEGIGEWLAAE